MSGEKRRYVRVEDQELRRLREQESRLKSIRRDLPKRLEQLRSQAQQDLQLRLEPLERRTIQHEQKTRELKSNLANLEKSTHQRLQQQRSEFKAALHDSEARQKSAMQAEVRQLEGAMREGFAKQHEMILEITTGQREEYLALNQQLDQKFEYMMREERRARENLEIQLQQEKQDKTSMAQNLIEDVKTIWEQIDQDYQHQKFAPGQLSNLKREIDLAENSLSSGVPEAAIGSLQQTYLKLADLRLEIEQKEQEWLLYYSSALEDLRALLEEVRAHKECEVEIGQGDEAEQFRVEVNYWTGNRLNLYEEELESLEKKLKEGEDSLTMEDVQQLALQIDSQQNKLSEIINQAKEEILSSQMRVEIADKVAETLKSMGYLVINPQQDAIYEEGDQRRAYVLKLQNAAEGEVVTVISPQRDEGKGINEFGRNVVSINSFGSTLEDEKAQEQYAKAVTEALREEGLAIEKEECIAEPQYQYQDMEKVLEVKAKTIS